MEAIGSHNMSDASLSTVKLSGRVSCLTLTKDRLLFLKQAVTCYCRQTHENKELIIVSAGTRRYQAAVRNFVDSLDRSDIHVMTLSSAHVPIGVMRNISLDQVSGEFICQWDDDDLYHPDRIKMQYQSTIDHNSDACYLTDHLQFFPHTRQMYWIDWRLFRTDVISDTLVPGTLFMKRNGTLRYPELDHAGEDNVFRNTLYHHFPTYALSGHGYLYVYRVHRMNQCPVEHHHQITAHGCVSRSYLQERIPQLKSTTSTIPLPMPFHLLDQSGVRIHTFNHLHA